VSKPGTNDLYWKAVNIDWFNLLLDFAVLFSLHFIFDLTLLKINKLF
jgi:hypothetical protein